jgi:hypothetical protein
VGGREYIIRLYKEEQPLVYRLYVGSNISAFYKQGSLTDCIIHAEMVWEPSEVAAYYTVVIGEDIPHQEIFQRCRAIGIESALGRQCVRLINAYASALELGEPRSNIIPALVQGLRGILANARSNELRNS